MKNVILQGVIALFSLTMVATGAQVYNLGLPCGPGAQVCTYDSRVTSASVTTDGGNSVVTSPGATSQYVWWSQAIAEFSYWESAMNDGSGGWSQSIGGFSSSTFEMGSWSDYFTYGCCEPDWWQDIVVVSNSQTVSQSGWTESLRFNGVEFIHILLSWGSSIDTWDSYSRQSGASYYPGGSSTYSNESRSNGRFVVQPWGNYFEERYPAQPTETPESSSCVLVLSGGLMLAVGRWRRNK